MSVLGEPSKVIIDNRSFPQSLNDGIHYDILKGNEDCLLSPYATQSFSNSNINFSISAPSQQAFLDRKAFIRLTAKLTVNKLANGGSTNTVTGLATPSATDYFAISQFFNQRIALRCYAPLHGACSSVTYQLNNSNFSYYPQIYQNAVFPWYGPYINQASTNLGDLSYPDQSWSYNNIITAPRNPLATYASSVYGAECRGSAFDTINVITNSATQLVVDVTWTERIYLPPFSPFDCNADKVGLSGLSNLDFTFNLGDTGRIFSLNTAALTGNDAYVSSSVDLTAANPVIYLNWITNKLGNREYLTTNKYAVSLYNSYVSSFSGLVAPGDTKDLPTNVCQVNSVPSAIYLFVQERQADKKIYTTDTFMKIDNIALSFGTKQGLMSTSIPSSLYQTSVRNGLKMSNSQNNYLCGSVIKLDLQKDISLGDLAIGSKGLFNIQVNIRFTNISGRSINCEAVLVTISEGVLEISDGNALVYQGLVDDKIIYESKVLQPIDADIDQLQIQGGCSLSECGRMFAKKAEPYARKAAKLLPGGNYLETAIDLASLGPQAYELYKMYTGKGMHSEMAYKKAIKMSGGGLVGGRTVKNKAKLRAALRY